MELSIVVKDKDGKTKAAVNGVNRVVLAWKGEYEKGDQIVFTVPETERFYIARADDTMDEAYIYMKARELIFDIPFDEQKTSYNPKAFTGARHYLTIRRAEDYEIAAYKNLAANVMDQHGERGCFPHACANVETRGEAVFAARNAIDGVTANLSHGKWPYESWGINMQDDAEFTLDFGRPVDFDKILLYTRADFPHDNWWEKVTFTFSDNTQETVELKKRVEPHMISLKRTGITWIKLGNLIKAEDPSPFPALTQIEVYGREHQ